MTYRIQKDPKSFKDINDVRAVHDPKRSAASSKVSKKYGGPDGSKKWE